MKDEIISVDVRDDIRGGREPFSRIMQVVSGLSAGQPLLLLAPFEPVPLYHVLGAQGFQHKTTQTITGDWEVLFTRAGDDAAGEAEVSAQPSPAARPGDATELVFVDARGLEPPQPMVRILEALVSLPAGAELSARTDRCPLHLYAQLEARGFTAQTEEQPDGSHLTHIRRR